MDHLCRTHKQQNATLYCPAPSWAHNLKNRGTQVISIDWLKSNNDSKSTKVPSTEDDLDMAGDIFAESIPLMGQPVTGPSTPVHQTGPRTGQPGKTPHPGTWYTMPQLPTDSSSSSSQSTTSTSNMDIDDTPLDFRSPIPMETTNPRLLIPPMPRETAELLDGTVATTPGNTTAFFMMPSRQVGPDTSLMPSPAVLSLLPSSSTGVICNRFHGHTHHTTRSIVT